MQPERIALAVDRTDRPMNFTQLLWTSAGSPWSGFRLERHAVGPRGRLQEFDVPDVLLGLCVQGTADMHVGSGTRAFDTRVQPGHFTLLAAGPQPQAIAWHGMRETLYVSIARSELDRLLGPDVSAGTQVIEPQYGVTDPQVSRLVLNMHEEVLAGCPTGTLYDQALSLALANYLLCRYGHCERRDPSSGTGLSRAQTARVRDYIEARIGTSVALTELADLVGLSSHHFSLRFKQTFGDTPHHYLLVRRIETAKKLLAARRHSIGETALEVGFANQSHFTRIFRRIEGRTPRQFQQCHS